jgi:hypothetical protein
VRVGSSYTDTELQMSEEQFQYRVRAYNKNGYGPYAAVQIVSLPVPDAPYGLSASTAWPAPVVAQNHVYWMVSSTGDLYYEIERAQGAGSFVKVGSVPALSPSTRGANFVDTVPVPQRGVQVLYRVRAWNDFGCSGYSQAYPVML